MKKRYVLVSMTIFLVLGVLVSFFAYNKKSSDIDNILSTKSYAYLPMSAKDFIRNAYEQSGTILLTEKNKESGKTYLNPEYIAYLELSEEEKRKISVIPVALLLDVDYSSMPSKAEVTIPSKYDLRDTDNNPSTQDTYITALKNQSSLNICWAFSSIEDVESNLMVTGNKPNQTLQLSPRQMDYALSVDGISNYGNMHGLRELGSAGNFSHASYAMVNGISLVNETTMPFNTSYNTYKYHEVFNYSNSLYEVNQTSLIPILKIADLNLSNSSDLQKKINYLATVKSRIMSYGGAYIATESPNHSCAYKNGDSYLIRVDGKCTKDSGHAMQIIGWDDNYSYKYCNTGNVHTAWTSSCPSANTVSGTGAWLLRNSWGLSYSYVYLAYDSLDSELGFVEKVVPMSSRKWQNNYHTTLLYNGGFYSAVGTSTTFLKRPKVNEIVDAVKIYAYTIGGSYDVQICNTEATCSTVGKITSEYPGYNTVSLSSKNITLTNDSFIVKVIGNDSEFLVNSVSVFTHNASTSPLITTEMIESDSSGVYEFGIQSYTKNIPDGALVTYKLFNSSGTDVSSYIQVANNYVTLNEVHGAIKINPSVGTGTYTLKANYGSYTSTSKVLLNGTELSGAGTESNPYLIDSVAKLKLINNNHAYYKLTTDLDISSYAGTFTGITKFAGILDGDGHTIKNGSTHLIETIYGNSDNTVTIKNLILKNFNVKGNEITGILADKLYDNGYNVNITNVAVIGGSVSSYSHTGAIVGRVYASTTNKVSFNGIYNSAEVSGSVSSGIVGSLYHEITSDTIKVDFKNIQNVGYIKDTLDNAGYIVGLLQYVVPTINGFIVSGPVPSDVTTFNAVIGGTSVPESVYNSTITNGYYTDGARSVPNILGKYPSYTNGAVKKAGYNLTLNDISSFPNYATYWVANTVDGVARMPMLKIANSIEYTSFKQVSVKEGSTVSIYNYMSPSIVAAKKIVATSNNTNIATVDSSGNVKGIAAGPVKLTVKSNYDGYVGTVIVNVLGTDTVNITYNANGGTGLMEKTTVTKNKAAILPNNVFTRKGYIFNGWNTKSDGSGTSYNNGTTISSVGSNITLYAKWTPITYYVSYNVNGGSGTYNKTSLKYDEALTLPAGPKPVTGYVFAYWNTKADGTGTDYEAGKAVKNLTSTNNSTVTLYAKYNEITYNLVYNYGYNNLSEKVTLKYSKNHSIIDIPVYREYEFIGWNTKADGTGEYFYPNETVNKLSATNGATLNLYGIWSTTKIWSINNYTYNSNGNYLENVVNNTNRSSYFNNFNIASGYTIKVYNGSSELNNNDLIGTGSITKIMKNNKVVFQVTNIVRGDINGDGKVTSADYILIRKHIMETERITLDYKKSSADINKDSKITSADYILIRKYIMNGGTL